MITFKIADECSKFLSLLGQGGILCNKFADLCFKLAFLSIYSKGFFQDLDIPESCRRISLGSIGSNLSCICSCLGCISRCLCFLYILLDRRDDSLYDILIISLKVSQTGCEVKTFDGFESSLYLTDSFLQTADSLYGSIDISSILLGQIVVLNVGNCLLEFRKSCGKGLKSSDIPFKTGHSLGQVSKKACLSCEILLKSGNFAVDVSNISIGSIKLQDVVADSYSKVGLFVWNRGRVQHR